MTKVNSPPMCFVGQKLKRSLVLYNLHNYVWRVNVRICNAMEDGGDSLMSAPPHRYRIRQKCPILLSLRGT